MFPRPRRSVVSTFAILAALAITLTLPPSAPAQDAKTEKVVLKECRILLIDTVPLASDRNGLLEKVPEEGDAVVATKVAVSLRADVAAAALAVAKRKAVNDVEMRYSEKAAAVAWAEFNRTTVANQKRSGTVPEVEVKRLELAAKRSDLQMEQAQEQMKIHLLEQAQAQAEYDSYFVPAPFDGVVTKVFRRAGESVRQGDPVIEIVSTARLRVEGEVPLRESWNLKPGQPVLVKLNDPDVPPAVASMDFTGKLVFVDATTEPVSKTTRVWAEVQNRNGILRAGLPARMTILPAPPATPPKPPTTAMR